MAMRFKRRETVESGIRRIADEQLIRALSALDDVDHQPEKSVHQVRTRMKKLRALVRLIRKPLGKQQARRSNIHFRDTARLLAASRDAVMRLKALDALLEDAQADDAAHTTPSSVCTNPSDGEPATDTPTLADDPDIAALRAALVPEDDGADQPAKPPAEVIDQVRHRLETARSNLAEWSLGRGGFELLAPGFKRSYRRGRDAMRQAYQSDASEDFHEWRKRVKDLWYQLRLLENAWPDMIETYDDSLSELSDCLGDHQDLMLLRAALTSKDDPPGDPATRRRIRTLLDRRMKKFRRAARPIAGRIYAEKPGRFVDRLDAYWRCWRKR